MKLSLMVGERAYVATSYLLSDSSPIKGMRMADIIKLVRARKALQVFADAMEEVRKRLTSENAAEKHEDGQVILDAEGVEKYRLALAEEIEFEMEPFADDVLASIELPPAIGRDLAVLYA